MPALIICKFDEDTMKTEHARLETFFYYKSIGFFFLRLRASNSQLISDLAGIRTHPRHYACPGYLQVWWRSDDKWRYYRVHNIFSVINLWCNIGCSRTSNSKANSQIWSRIELVRDFMPVLLTCKFEDGCFIKNEGAIMSTFFRCSRASNSEVNGQMLPDFELIRDFMLVLVTCKFDDDPIENKDIIVATTFSFMKRMYYSI